MTPLRPILTAAWLMAGAAAVLPYPAAAQCVPAMFPPNWLAQQEAPNVPAAPPPNGGHTIAQHVGKTDPQLIARVVHGGVASDGSYPTVVGAQAAITTALAADAVAVNTWRGNVGVGAMRGFNYAAPAHIGRVAFLTAHNAVAVTATCAFRAVMRALPAGGCYLHSAYPRPPTPADNCPMAAADALHGYLMGHFADSDLLGLSDEQAAVDGVAADSRSAYADVLAEGRAALAAPRLDWRRVGDSANRRFAGEPEARTWLEHKMDLLEAALKRL